MPCRNASQYPETGQSAHFGSGPGAHTSAPSSIIAWVNAPGSKYPSVSRPFPEPPDDPLTAREEDLEELLDRAAGYSGFAHEEELRQSFLTRPDGTRIGIAFSGGPGRPRAGVGSLCIRFPVAREGEPQPLLDGILLLHVPDPAVIAQSLP